MNNPYFPAMAEVGDRIIRTPHLLLGLEFDGTLTPLVDEPAKAFLSSSMRRVLWSLAARSDVSLVIMSGRKRADIQERVGIAGIIYGGNHGLEIHGPDFNFIEPAAAAHRPTLKEIYVTLMYELRHIPGVFVEDKGLTLSIHQRRVAAAHRENVWNIVYTAWTASKDLFDLTRGNMVYEIRPKVNWNKGAALIWIRDRLGRSDILTMYVGDDATAEDVFMRLSDGITIKIGDIADTQAHFLIAGPTELQSFLEWIDQLLAEKKAAPTPMTEPSQSTLLEPAKRSDLRLPQGVAGPSDKAQE